MMNNLKALALIGVVATSVSAHYGDEHRELLHQKAEFINTCSAEVIMCEDIITKEHAKDFIIVDPDASNSGGEEPMPSDDPAAIARQCIQTDLAICLPVLNTKDPVAISRCVMENRQEIWANFKDISDECKQAFRDLLHHKVRRHAREEDEEVAHLSAPGTEIGACLVDNTQNLTARCLSAVEYIDATGGDWYFLDAEEEEAEHGSRKHLHFVMGFIMFTLLLCCCVRAYKRKRGCSRGCSGNASTPTVNGEAPVVQPRADVPEDPELARAIAASLAETGRRPSAPPARSYQPPEPVDVAYTGAALHEPMLQATATFSDQYV